MQTEGLRVEQDTPPASGGRDAGDPPLPLPPILGPRGSSKLCIPPG